MLLFCLRDGTECRVPGAYFVLLTVCMVLPDLSSMLRLSECLSAVRTENPGSLLQNTVPAVLLGVRVREPEVLTT